MNGTLPPFPVEDTQSLVKLNDAHRALHLVNEQYKAEVDAVVRAAELKHAPFLYAAQSVLYEAMRNASLNGFDGDELTQAMGCNGH